MIHFFCPNCSVRLRVPDDKAQAKFVCPKCNTHFRLHKAAQTPPLIATEPEETAASPAGGPSEKLVGAAPVAVSSSPRSPDDREEIAQALVATSSKNLVPAPPVAVSPSPDRVPKAIPDASGHFRRRLLPALGAEFRAIFGVLPLLHRPVWIIWGLCFLAAFVGLLSGVWAVFAQLLVVIGLGTVALFSGTLAKRLRRRKWVEFPDGPEVAPYLPQLITLLAGPPYFVAMIILFVQAATAFPGILPTAGWLDALLLALDNFVRTEIFFNAAECFHLRFDGEVEDRLGKSLVFISRLPMDLAFIKLAVQLLHAAYYRARGPGPRRGHLVHRKAGNQSGRRAAREGPVPASRRLPARRRGHAPPLLAGGW